MEMVAFRMRKRHWFALGLVMITGVVLLVFFINQSQRVRIPVSFTSAGTPAILATIEGKNYYLQFDLGSKFQLSLSKDVLQLIQNKKSHEVAHWRDAKGNFYESPSYLIPRIKIENLVLNNVIANQEDTDFKTHTTLWNDRPNEDMTPGGQYLGNLGRPLLEKTNLLLNFQDSIIIACNDGKQVKEEGFILDNMLCVPFEKGNGIIIKVDTEVGVLKLGLDTGSTITLVRASRLQGQKCEKDQRGFSVYTSPKFMIGDKDFGCKNLFLYDITSELHEIDGVLGMDFLKHHAIYIDYKNKVVYIGDSQQQPT